MTVFVYVVLALVVMAALVALAVLVLPGNEELAPAPPDRTPWALPAERAMTGPDVGRLRLPVTLRGYRFAETDAVLDRLGEEISYRDSVIQTLRAELASRDFSADDARGEVLVAERGYGAPAADDVEPDESDALVELGETPEESEGEQPEGESPDGEPAVTGPRVVALDDELPELHEPDDAPPDGPATRP